MTRSTQRLRVPPVVDLEADEAQADPAAGAAEGEATTGDAPVAPQPSQGPDDSGASAPSPGHNAAAETQPGASAPLGVSECTTTSENKPSLVTRDLVVASWNMRACMEAREVFESMQTEGLVDHYVAGSPSCLRR